MSFCLFAFMPLCVSVFCLSACMSLCVYVFLSFCLSVFLSFCLSVFLSFCLPVFLSSCLSFFLSFSLSNKISEGWNFKIYLDRLCWHARLSFFSIGTHYLCLSVFLSSCFSVSLSFCHPVFLSLCLSVILFFYLYVFLSICLSVSLSLCLTVYPLFIQIRLLYVLMSSWYFHKPIFNFFEASNWNVWSELSKSNLNKVLYCLEVCLLSSFNN